MNNVNPTTRQLINRTALAILAAYALTTIHHIYGGLVDRAPNRLRVPGIMAIPSLITLRALYRSGSRATAHPQRKAFSARLGQNHCICIQTEIRTSRAIPPHSLQRLGQRLATEVPRLLLLRKLADREVRLLPAGTRSAEGHTKDLHLRTTGARAIRPASHLARLLLRLGQGNLQSASF